MCSHMAQTTRKYKKNKNGQATLRDHARSVEAWRSTRRWSRGSTWRNTDTLIATSLNALGSQGCSEEDARAMVTMYVV